MLFKELEQQIIELPAKSKLDIDAQDGVLLVPTNNDKIYVYWINEKEKIIASHTLTKPTLVTKNIQLSNPKDTDTTLIKLVLPNQNG
jgi:hypothetical protein